MTITVNLVQSYNHCHTEYGLTDTRCTRYKSVSVKPYRVWLDYNGVPGQSVSVPTEPWLDRYNGEPGQSVSLPTEYGLTITVNLVRVYHCQQSMA